MIHPSYGERGAVCERLPLGCNMGAEQGYHCKLCEFDLCIDCYNKTPEQLTLTNTLLVSKIKLLPRSMRLEIAKFSIRITQKEKNAVVKRILNSHTKLYKKWH